MQGIVNKKWENTTRRWRGSSSISYRVPCDVTDLFLILYSRPASVPRNSFHPVAAWSKDHTPQGPALHNNDSLFILAPGHFK